MNLPKDEFVLSETTMVWLRRLSSACYIFATILFLSPAIAAHSIIPWMLYIVGNGVWLIDSMRVKNKEWIALSLFFICWDTLLIVSRTAGVNVIETLKPITSLLEKILL